MKTGHFNLLTTAAAMAVVMVVVAAGLQPGHLLAGLQSRAFEFRRNERPQLKLLYRNEPAS
jgi:hypothetical protein